MQSFKIIVEKHKAGYVAYPLGLKGVVVGKGIPTRTLWPTRPLPLNSTLRHLERKCLNQGSPELVSEGL